MTEALIGTAVPLLTEAAGELADELDLAGHTARSKVS
jgi:hypothetical protein